jgi:hypothetical protein
MLGLVRKIADVYLRARKRSRQQQSSIRLLARSRALGVYPHLDYDRTSQLLELLEGPFHQNPNQPES